MVSAKSNNFCSRQQDPTDLLSYLFTGLCSVLNSFDMLCPLKFPWCPSQSRMTKKEYQTHKHQSRIQVQFYVSSWKSPDLDARLQLSLTVGCLFCLVCSLASYHFSCLNANPAKCQLHWAFYWAFEQKSILLLCWVAQFVFVTAS